MGRISGLAPGTFGVLVMSDDSDFDRVSPEQVRKLLTMLGIDEVLKAAQHDLVTLNGLTATDKPTAKLGKFSYVVNVKATLDKLAALLDDEPKAEAQPEVQTS